MATAFGEPQTIGVDTGGTFTDIVMMDESGAVRVDKIPSNPSDPSSPVLEGLPARSEGSSFRVVHGTTVATNALLERKHARTALITTAGFEDILEIGRQNRPLLYDIHPRKPPPIIPRDLRFGVMERVLHDGTIHVPLNGEQVREILEEVRAKGVLSIAVCLLHSYVNPSHEEIVGEIARERGFTVSLSSRVLPEFREFERTATVAVNASLRPVMERYLGKLEQSIGRSRLTVMQSAGGIMPAAIAARLPVHTVLSGPAGGVIAAAEKGRSIGLDRIITFDMGGTSTDVSLYDRRPSLTSEKTIAGNPIRVSVIDIHTVAAGGGTIAYRDPGGGLKVGPVSAGADPGPVCYGRGDRIAVTDANLFLGRLEPAFFLGGRMEIYPHKVREPMERLAASLNLEPTALAEGIIAVANSVMERAIRVISIERGHDPREFTLVTFGGAGGLHAVELARALNIPRVMIPRDAGVFSAHGMVLADVTRDLSRTILARTDQLSRQVLDAALDTMIRSGTEELAREGVDPAGVSARLSLDMRYEGQSYEINVPLSDDPAGAFHEAHERRYGYRLTTARVEIVNVRVRLIAAVPRPQEKPLPLGDRDPSAGIVGRRGLVYGGDEVEALIFDRDLLEPGAEVEGPALVGESTSTIFLPPGSRGRMDEYKNMMVVPG